MAQSYPLSGTSKGLTPVASRPVEVTPPTPKLGFPLELGGDSQQSAPPEEMSWAQSLVLCGAQLGLAGVTVLGLLAWSRGSSTQSSAPTVSSGLRSAASLSVDPLIADLGQKMAFRDLVWTIPLSVRGVGGGVEGDHVSAETWIAKASDLYSSLAVSERVLREVLGSKTNQATSGLTFPSPAVLTSSQQRDRFIEALRSAANAPEHEALLKGGSSERYEPFANLHERWPRLALAVLLDRFKEIDAMNKEIERAPIVRPFLDKLRSSPQK
jgi:hypothetical protein